jgi:hypothetical protein
MLYDFGQHQRYTKGAITAPDIEPLSCWVSTQGPINNRSAGHLGPWKPRTLITQKELLAELNPRFKPHESCPSHGSLSLVSAINKFSWGQTAAFQVSIPWIKRMPLISFVQRILLDILCMTFPVYVRNAHVLSLQLTVPAETRVVIGTKLVHRVLRLPK